LEKTNDCVILYTYDVDGSLISFNYLGTEYFYVKDILGNIVRIIDATGTTLVEYQYDAYGNILYTLDNSGTLNLSHINPYRYRSYRYDEEISYYYCNARYYQPIIGRWLNADSVRFLDPEGTGGLNLFAYCANNPVMNVDPNGKFVISILICSIIIGAIIGGVLGGVTASQSGSDVATGIITGALLGAGVGAIVGIALAGGGVAYFSSAGISTLSKLTTDLFSYTMYGTPFGTWEDYALAFTMGGLMTGSGIILQIGEDIIARPLMTQLFKMGTRGTEFNLEKFGYDVITRAATHFIPAPWKSFVRGITRGYWDVWGNESYNEFQFNYA